MVTALSTPANRRRSVLLLIVAFVAAAAAVFVGIDDNLPGIALAFLAAAALLLSFAHPWRRSIQFRYLFYASALGFLVFGLLHSALEALAHSVTGGTLTSVLGVVSVVAFLVAALLCPTGLLVGGVGAVLTAIRPPKPRETAAPLQARYLESGPKS